ncbi:DUF6279 family lipoprotein [Variovorax sp. J22R133]|uniref:DUF6279 family lipoprotein n=1 Tax=Variovorax brevis TaxID=3053503 RepID=UPI0025755C02|nr:DUF6279 family lipoprotein [Variovorax sp. J22R133]MDM0111456.1 DUF6279 family lipoprotein [Variovorax sp. J22R133]
MRAELHARRVQGQRVPLAANCCSVLAKLLCAVLLGMALAGCSAVKIAYNNLPDISYWWLDSYVDFDSVQTPRVREQLTLLLERHRKTELPKLLVLVEKAERMAPGDITAAQVCDFSEDVRKSLLATALDAAEPGAHVAMSLSEAQLQHLQEKYAKKNAEYADDWLDKSVEKQRQKRYDSFLDRSEDFYGTLDGTQRKMLRQQIDRSIFDPRRMDAERRRRQQDALALLRGFSGNGSARVSEVQAAFVAYVKRISDPPPGPWRDYQQALLHEGCTNIAQMHNATRPEQREQAVRRIQAYAQDLRDLAAAP